MRGFRLNAQENLNFGVHHDNVMEEVRHRLGRSRDIPVWNPHKIVRDNRDKRLLTETEIKRYQFVFDNRVVDPRTFMSFHSGFEQFEMTKDEDNLDILLQL